jgi:hypothetical protein
MSSALKHPCDEEFIRSTRAEAVALRPEVAAGNGYPGLGGRVRALRRTRPWGVILDHLFPHGRSDGVRTCDPGPCGDYGGVEPGGDQALGSRLGDQQLLLPDSRPPGNCRPRHHHVRQLRREPGRPHVPLGSAARCQAAVGGREAPAGAAEAPASIDAGSRAAVEQAIDEAFFSGYRVVMLVATAASLASALGAALLIEGGREGTGGAARRPGDGGTGRLRSTGGDRGRSSCRMATRSGTPAKERSRCQP